MRYLLLIYEEPPSTPPTEEEWAAMMPEYNASTAWLRDTGQYLGGEALQPVETATTVSVRDGQRIVTDGPFARSHPKSGCRSAFRPCSASCISSSTRDTTRRPATLPSAVTCAQRRYASRVYELLARPAPSPVVVLNRAVALAEVAGPAAGLAAIDALGADPAMGDYRFFHAARADLFRWLGRWSDAAAAYERALALAANEPEQAFLAGRLREVKSRSLPG